MCMCCADHPRSAVNETKRVQEKAFEFFQLMDDIEDFPVRAARASHATKRLAGRLLQEQAELCAAI